jgi:RNA polymerase sigma factor (sigma-70 family)
MVDNAPLATESGAIRRRKVSDTAVTVHGRAASRAEANGFARVYERHHQALYRYCRSILRHEEDAQDALQSAMMRAFAALQTDRRDLELKPWLFRIAHNEAVSILRRRTATCALDEDLRDGAALEDRVLEREALRQLRADLAGLTERQRWALVLRELNGLSHGEIAAVLETSPAVVKQAIFEARSALLRCREGRDTACAEIRRVLSDGDGRVLRARPVRAHLQTCSGCRAFHDDLRGRPLRLAALAPPLPAGMAATLLRGLVGGSGGAASAGAGLVAKAALGVALAGGAVAWHAHPLRPAHRTRPTPAARATAAPASRVTKADVVVAAPPRRAPASGVARRPAAKPVRTHTTPARHAAPRGEAHKPAAPTATGPAAIRTAGPAGGPAEAEKAPAAIPPGQAKKAAGSTGATTAPGHSGTAPGQVKKAAGSTGATTAPGHSGTAPGQVKKAAGSTGATTAPGHSGTAPGHSGTAPGQAKKAAGTSDTTTPPGQAEPAADATDAPAPADTPAASAPGHSGAAPGHSGKG